MDGGVFHVRTPHQLCFTGSSALRHEAGRGISILVHDTASWLPIAFSSARSHYFFCGVAAESLVRFPGLDDGDGPRSLARSRRFLARFLACARLRVFSRALIFGIAGSMLFLKDLSAEFILRSCHGACRKGMNLNLRWGQQTSIQE